MYRRVTLTSLHENALTYPSFYSTYLPPQFPTKTSAIFLFPLSKCFHSSALASLFVSKPFYIPISFDPNPLHTPGPVISERFVRSLCLLRNSTPPALACRSADAVLPPMKTVKGTTSTTSLADTINPLLGDRSPIHIFYLLS